MVGGSGRLGMRRGAVAIIYAALHELRERPVGVEGEATSPRPGERPAGCPCTGRASISTPAAGAKSTAARCVPLPTPTDAQLGLPGRALGYASSSAMQFTGSAAHVDDVRLPCGERKDLGLHRIVGELPVQPAVDRHRGRPEHQRVAVGRRLAGRFHAVLPPAPGRASTTIGCGKLARIFLGHAAREDVGPAAGGERRQQAHAACRDRAVERVQFLDRKQEEQDGFHAATCPNPEASRRDPPPKCAVTRPARYAFPGHGGDAFRQRLGRTCRTRATCARSTPAACAAHRPFELVPGVGLLAAHRDLEAVAVGIAK